MKLEQVQENQRLKQLRDGAQDREWRIATLAREIFVRCVDPIEMSNQTAAYAILESFAAAEMFEEVRQQRSDELEARLASQDQKGE